MNRTQVRQSVGREFQAEGPAAITAWLARFSVALAVLAVSPAGNAAESGPLKPPLARAAAAKVKSYTPSFLNLDVTIDLGRPAKARTITYTLVTPPKHGSVVLPEPQETKEARPAAAATYTSTRDFVGEDEFSWKASDGSADSDVVTTRLAVGAAVPSPEPQMVHVMEGAAVDFPATYTGGGGYAYKIHADKPAHGELSLEGNNFRYRPENGFCGNDQFDWCMSYPTEKGEVRTTPVTCWLVVKAPGMKDWPQWRADEWRSGFTTMELPGTLCLQWRRDLPATKSPFAAYDQRPVYPDIDFCRPVQLGKTLFVPVTASDCLVALDTESGAVRWRFYASGAVRRPPVAVASARGTGLVIFGSDDGWLYALDAGDGSVRWKFRAAPNNRKAMGFGRLSSVWPIWASPVASEGKVYVVAGYVPMFGLYGYCLDAATGAVVWENDGRISDVWNTSALGPLAMSFDRRRLYGTVEGACVPWVVDSATGEFLGHIGVGFSFPGAMRSGINGWYVDGRGTHGENYARRHGNEMNPPEPAMITAGSRQVTFASTAALGVEGKVASLLAGYGKLFVATAEGRLYCFGEKAGNPTVHPRTTKPLAEAADGWTSSVEAMLSRNDLKHGLALVWGLGSGRLVEELARQSSLVIVAVDPDHAKLQALRAKMDVAGVPAARVSTLEGSPMDFAFAPYQAAIIASEDLAGVGFPAGGDGQEAAVQRTVAAMYACLRPHGGEIWLPTSDRQHALIADWATNLPHSAVARQAGRPGAAGSFTQIQRQGLPDDKLRLEPPFGLTVFGRPEQLTPFNVGPGVVCPGHDTYTWLPLPGPPADRTTRDSGLGEDKVFRIKWPRDLLKEPTKRKWDLSTANSVFTRLRNPLLGLTETFSELPDGNRISGSCGGEIVVGDVRISLDKMDSFFDASERYWGRFFMPGRGGCAGPGAGAGAGGGVFIEVAKTCPGDVCGCSPNMQFTGIVLAPMEGEETWVAYQTARTSQAVEELPIRQIGVNFGAQGDRYVREEGTLWTHHPYAGRQGQHSHTDNARPEALPLVPVGYRGSPVSVYRHSAQMARGGGRDRAWVAASYVKGMTEITVPLAQPAVAIRTALAPKVDGKLDDVCWDGRQRVAIVPDFKVPSPGDQCFAMFRYDDANLYVAGGGPVGKDRWPMSVTLNSRERAAGDVVVTCLAPSGNGVVYKAVSKGVPADAWTCAALTSGGQGSAEIAIPWKVLEAAGLWREHLVVNVAVAGSPLTASSYTPLYLDEPRGVMTETHPHTVRLTFAEMEGKKPGERVFDVSLQGKPVLNKLDVVKEAGGPKREITKEFPGIHISDRLTIGFEAVAGEPMLSGVEIVGQYKPADHRRNQPPTAKIAASAASGPTPLEVTFSAQGSQDPDGQIVQCAWDTGDGRLAKGSLLRHVYAEPGVYKVHLLVRDNRGAMTTAQTTVAVTPGVPAALLCAIRARGGDYASLSAWEAAMRSDLTSRDSLVFAVKHRGSYAAADDGTALTFTGGGKGTLQRIDETDRAYVSGCEGLIQSGPVRCASGHTFQIADTGQAIARSLLFTVKERGTYVATDDGAAVTFGGGAKGILRHINAANIAYITGCDGMPQPGKVTCASGHAFQIADAGHPVHALVAECHNDWPGGLADNISAPRPEDSPRWVTSPLRCVTVRPALGQGHRGMIKDPKGNYTGIALKGNLDLSHLSHARLFGMIVDSSGALAMGKGASLSRVLAGEVRLGGGSMAASVVGSALGAANAPGSLNYHPSFYNWIHMPSHYRQPANSDVSFYNSTARTFDPGDQAGVEFINCLAAPGGKGFHDDHYADGAYASHCVSADDSATRWDSGDGSEENMSHQEARFVNAAAGDYHLHSADKAARGRGAPGLGPDIAGRQRTGPPYDVGAAGPSPNAPRPMIEK